MGVARRVYGPSPSLLLSFVGFRVSFVLVESWYSMALVADTVARVALFYVDRDNNQASVSAYYGSDNTVANIIAEVEGVLAPAVSGMVDAVLTGYSINFGADDTAVSSANAPETSDVERKGSFVFKAANGQIVSMQLPSVKNTLVVDGTNVINSADALTVAFVAAVTTAGVDGLQPTTNIGEPVISLERPGRKIHRGSSKG